MDNNFELYDGKSFKDLCKTIVTNQSDRKEQIEVIIADLRPLIKTINDALQVVPLIKQYIDAGISNDESLIKLVQLCQKITTAESNFDGKNQLGLTEEEKKELMKTISDVSKTESVIVTNISKSKK